MSDSPENNNKGFNLSKIIEWLFCLFFVCILISVIAGFFPLSHPVLTEYFNSKVDMNRPDSCVIGKVTITAWKGIHFHNVSVFKTAGENGVYNIHLSKVKVSGNFIPLLLKWPKLKHEFADVQEKFNEKINEDPVAAADLLLEFITQQKTIESILVDGRRAFIEKRDEKIIGAEKFSFDIIRDSEDDQELSISLDAAEFHCLKNVITFLRASSVYSNNVLRITRCRGRAFDGKIKISSEIDMKKRYHNGTSLIATDLKIDQIMKLMDNSTKSVSGRVDVDLNLMPSMLIPDSLRGKGAVKASDIQISNLPIQQSLVHLLNAPILNNLHFQKIKADFEIVNQKTFYTEINGSGGMVDFKSKGEISLPENMNQNVEAAFSEEVAKQFPELIIKTLYVGENQRRTVRCRIYNTFSDPCIELDKEILKKAIGNVFEQMKENFIDFFRKK